MKKTTCIFLIILCSLIVLTAATLGFFACQQPKDLFPTEGIWYCEELGMQIQAKKSHEYYESYIKKEDQYICCSASTMRGLSRFMVTCEDRDTVYYNYGEIIFSGEYIRADEQSFTVREVDGNNEYTFKRLLNYISDPATQFYVINGHVFSVEEINASIKSTFAREMTTGSRDSNIENIFLSEDSLSVKPLQYDLYCSTQNRSGEEVAYYDESLYVYIVITDIASTAIDLNTEVHMFAFHIAQTGMQPNFSEEIHAPNQADIAFLSTETEYVGNFSMG